MFKIIKTALPKKNNEVLNLTSGNLLGLIKQLYDCKKRDFSLFDVLKKQPIDRQVNALKIKKMNPLEWSLRILMYLYKTNPDFLTILEKINEKQESQKKNGVFYTPQDITEYIIKNCVALHCDGKILCHSDKKTNTLESIQNMSVFDPTSGTGAFILKALEIKLSCFENPSTQTILKILKTLYGNDKDGLSIFILKIRCLFYLIDFDIPCNTIWKTMRDHFTTEDFLNGYQNVKNKFDLIVGNPPYVERNLIENKSNCKYGNIYADIIENSFPLLSKNGTIGFIIPLSYISTPRFKNLRQYIQSKTSIEYVSSFSDRPDCLFPGVHQKLNILMATRNHRSRHEVYTSDYMYWYKEERDQLFKQISYIKNPFVFENFYPKLGNETEVTILNKIQTTKGKFSYANNGKTNLFLNMRATFWIKAFMVNGQYSNEYKVLKLGEDGAYFMHILLNSSIFWWFWIKVSDCWHITQKDLQYFNIPTNYDREKAKTLSLELSKMLEETKEFVNTKQTLYEYKHKACKSLIDQIDAYIGKLYELSPKEILYLQNYKKQYRMGLRNET